MKTCWVQVFEAREAFSSEAAFNNAPTYLVEVEWAPRHHGHVAAARTSAKGVVKKCIPKAMYVDTASLIWRSLEAAIIDAHKWGVPDHTLVALHIMADGVRVPMPIIS